MTNMWIVELTPAARRQLEKLDAETNRKIAAYLDERVAGPGSPTRFGKALTGPLKGFWRYRVGDYRVVASIENRRLVVYVVDIDHRSTVYR